MATYTAALRLKEVGIRKVMGATVNQIVMLLSKDFMKLVALGLILAVPAARFAMENCLKDFAYKIDISWTTFAMAGAVAMRIAVLTISVQTIRAAIANQVNSLRMSNIDNVLKQRACANTQALLLYDLLVLVIG